MTLGKPLTIARRPAPSGSLLIVLYLIAVGIGLGIAVLPFGQLAAITAAMLAAIVIGAVFAEPSIGVALTLFVSPFGPLENITLHLPIESGQVLLLLTLSAWIARALYRRHLGLRAGPLAGPVVLFLGIGLLSFFAARSLELWAKECLKWVEVLAVYFLVTSEFRGDERARNLLIGAILVSTAFEGALGIFQFGLRGTGPHEFAIAGTRFYRAYGTFEQPNPFGGYMGLTWPFATGVAFHFVQESLRRLRSRDRFAAQALGTYALTAGAALTAAVALVALVLSWSRGAWLGAVAAALIMFIAVWRRPLASLSILGAVLIVIVAFNLTDLVPASLRSRLTDFTQEFSTFDVRGVGVNDANYAVIERLAHWQAAENMIVDRPYLGVGFGNYSAAYEQYRIVNWPIALGHAHNYYLNIFAETGIIGLIAYLTLWLAIFVRTVWVFARRSERADGSGASAQKRILLVRLASAMALGMLGAWVQLSVHNVVDNLYVANIFLLIGVYLGLMDGVTYEHSSSDR